VSEQFPGTPNPALVKRTPEQDLAKVESIALEIMQKCLDCPVHDVDATFTPLEAIIRRRLRELAEAEALIGQQKSAIQSMQINYDKQYNELTALRKQVNEYKEMTSRLEVAEKIMEHFFIEGDDTEVFKDYCKLCSENGDCEWGDNFPHCFSSSKEAEK
jgi:hypothetical protein